MGQDSTAVPVIVGLVVGIALVVSFSLLFGPTASFPPPNSIENVVITLERTVCFGSCPDYTLTIYGNGSLIYEGRNFVAVTGQQTSNISKDHVQELARAFYAIGYFSLEDEYSAAITDLPTTTTSIAIDGRYKKIVNYYGAPEQLIELENMIDDIAGSERWVGR
jgi:Domain of unknown function (DUF6438)